MADKYLPEEVSDKELAAMELAGELPEAGVQSGWVDPSGGVVADYSKSARDDRDRNMSRTQVISSPVGGETPEEAMTSWEAQRANSQAVGDRAWELAENSARDRVDGINRLSEALGLREGRGFDQFNPDVVVGLYRAHQQGKLTLGPEVLQIVAAIARSDSAQDKHFEAFGSMRNREKEAERSLGDFDAEFPERVKAHRDSAAKKALEP